MKVVSINVGQPQTVETPRGPVLTAIYKQPVEGIVQVKGYNIQGDRQADLTVHGGPAKAIYGYAFDHYDYWRKTLPQAALSHGNFGENLTVEGLTENQVHIGDRFRLGTTLLRVTQPRMPCGKLALRFNRSDMIKLFWKSRRSGIYFAIDEEGETKAGDDMTLLEPHQLKVRISDVLSLYTDEVADPGLFQRVMDSPLEGSWKNRIQELHAARAH